MTDREKLIELLDNVGSNILKFPTDGFIEHLAEYLLSNGVTVQQWIPVSEPPEVWKTADDELVNYILYMPDFGPDIGNYFKPANRWMRIGVPCKVTHWMQMPEPPKEV